MFGFDGDKSWEFWDIRGLSDENLKKMCAVCNLNWVKKWWPLERGKFMHLHRFLRHHP